MMDIPLGYILLSFVLCGVTADVCQDGEPVIQFDADSEEDPSIFDDLTTDEIQRVYDYMKGQFSIVEGDQVTIDSTYIYFIERRDPPKQEVLNYLENGGRKPDRNAWVILFRGDSTPPIIEEYEVGPLPEISQHKKLSYGTKDSVQYKRRPPFTPGDYPAWTAVVARETSKVDHILQHVTGGYTFNNCTDKCLWWLPALPATYESGQRSSWIFIIKKIEGFYLNPIGLQLKIDTQNSVSIDSWEVNVVWFRGTVYSSFEELAEKGTQGLDPDPPLNAPADSKELFSSLNQRGTPIPSKKQRGPMSFMPDGRRYTVNKHHIAWQGWEFYFNLRSLMGIQVHDVRFLSERIAYELSLSELGIVYSGASPSPLHTAYVDSPFNFGLETFELVPGIDCPDHATFFDFAHFYNFQPIVNKRSVCVFEQDRGLPIRRHYWSTDDGSYYIQGMPGNVLILRAAVTVYNYEYIIDHVFHQNGVLEVATSMAGYILTSFKTGTDREKTRGYNVVPNAIGQIHNHMMQFKVDLDIGQVKNRFSTLDISIEEEKDEADERKLLTVQKFVHNLRTTEMNATYKFNFDTPKYLLFSDNDKENKYGNKKSYRLLPVHMNKHLLPENFVAEKGMSWQRYQVAVTKQKDHERRGSSIFNLIDMADPLVSFSSFFEDDDDIVDEDLVAWVTLGAFHIPSSEDVPIVQTPSHSLTYFLLPFNYFDEDPSLASRDNIRFRRDADGQAHWDLGGVPDGVDCEPKLKKPRSGGNAISPSMMIGVVIPLLVVLQLESR